MRNLRAVSASVGGNRFAFVGYCRYFFKTEASPFILAAVWMAQTLTEVLGFARVPRSVVPPATWLITGFRQVRKRLVVSRSPARLW
jgi:hypothetical protein